ncbi:acyltransferase family protein [Ottowia thiooxydans]|uniref:Peptidoglycan/LPS O-acetylase OafA/YrhL n=1 Tax=Ottowia thiooxydans TaxID=219182 RepID=A0ABV2Q9D6_9BURK
MANAGRYQSHIDGLRAIAVIAVIANHLNPAWMPAGYLGVDMFFVISGYVISISLWEKSHWKLGDFLLDFYRRRARRLVPALAFMVLVAGTFVCLLVPEPMENLKTGVAALFGISNFVLYARASDYFATAIQANIFAHTWSLGVEEQFYLIYPLVFWLAMRCKDRQRAVLILVGGLSATSLLAFLWLYGSDPGKMYFLSPLRFWEMGAGALAFFIEKHTGITSRARWISPSAGVATIALVYLLFSPFKHATLMVVMVVILAAWVVVTAKINLILAGLLNTRLIQRIGLASYSLYLWHWVFIVLARWTFGLSAWTSLYVLLATFIFAEISYRFVESPFRHSRNLSPLIAGLSMNALVALTLVLGAPYFKPVFLKLEGEVLQSPQAFLDKEGFEFKETCIVDGEKRLLKNDTFEKCTLKPISSHLPTIWLMGDSHAGHLQAMLWDLHEETGVGVHLIETPGKYFPLVGGEFEPREKIFQRVKAAMRPHDIFMVSRIYLERYGDGVADDLDYWVEEVEELAEELNEKGVNLVVSGPPPIFNFEYKSSCASVLFPKDNCSVPREQLANRVNKVEEVLSQSAQEHPNMYVFSSFSFICPPNQKWCSPVDGDMFMYRDKDHLNVYGASKLTAGFEDFLAKKRLLP